MTSSDPVATDVQGMVEELREKLISEARIIEGRLMRHTVRRRDGTARSAGRLVNEEGPATISRLCAALESSQSPSPVSEEARATLSYAAGILAEVGKGHRRSDAEDDWLECPVCHKRVDHYGHAKTCRLRLAEAHIAGTLDRLAALSAQPPVWTPTEEQVEAMAQELHHRVYPEEPWEDCPGMWADHRETVRAILALNPLSKGNADEG